MKTAIQPWMICMFLAMILTSSKIESLGFYSVIICIVLGLDAAISCWGTTVNSDNNMLERWSAETPDSVEFRAYSLYFNRGRK